MKRREGGVAAKRLGQAETLSFVAEVTGTEKRQVGAPPAICTRLQPVDAVDRQVVVHECRAVVADIHGDSARGHHAC